MSQAAIEQFIGKALLNADFRDAFLANPEQALAAFALTSAEKSYIKCMDSETLDQLAAMLVQRSRFWVRGEQMTIQPECQLAKPVEFHQPAPQGRV